MKKNYPYLATAQFMAACLVILVHCGQLSTIPWLHFILKSIFARMAVPFFFVVNGFFYREQQKKNSHYGVTFSRRQLKTYLRLSILYLPYGIYILNSYSISYPLIPVALLFALFILGVCYHLWYFPALLFATWLVEKMLRRLDYYKSFALCLILYLLGSYETYSAYLSNSPVDFFYQMYKRVFLTTRNGLFFAPIFILIGFLLHDKQTTAFFQQKLPLKLAICGLLVSIEGWLIYQNQGDDKNFLLSLIPFMLVLVPLLLKGKAPAWLPHQQLRNISKGLFFWHPAILESINLVAFLLTGSTLAGLPLFLITISGTSLLLYIKKQGYLLPRLCNIKNRLSL